MKTTLARINKLEAIVEHDAVPSPSIVCIQSPDGKFRHGGQVFESREALERAFPTLFVICAEVYDGRKTPSDCSGQHQENTTC